MYLVLYRTRMYLDREEVALVQYYLSLHPTTQDS
jgi:hypothetical protein